MKNIFITCKTCKYVQIKIPDFTVIHLRHNYAYAQDFDAFEKIQMKILKNRQFTCAVNS